MESLFDFKRFSVLNGDSGLKVGTDGVLLGAVADVSRNPGSILDIGTGTGVVALMLAQRTEGAAAPRITGIDISEKATAGDNFASSPWAARMEYVKTSLACYMDGSPSPFDMIVSNPPYYDNSLVCPDDERTAARHCGTLSYREVITFSHDFLTPEGILSLILPTKEETALNRFAASFGFFPCRTLYIRTVAPKSPSRMVCEFSRMRGRVGKEWLTISDGNEYTDEYKELTKDFYLKF